MQTSLKPSLLRDLLPGLLPLLIFIIADEIWGTIIGLYVAVGFGFIELIFTYLHSGRFEKFILIDIGLLIMLGMVSVLLENEVFFKLKPVFIEGLLLILIGFSGFGKRNYILEMSGRYLKGMKIHESAAIKLNKSLKILFWIILAHTVLVLFSVFFMSTRSWGFISGILLYLLLGFYFLYEIIATRIQNRKYKGAEVVPLVDENGTITGRAIRSELHFNPEQKRLHPVVHLHVFNERGDIYLQRRPETKLIQPGKWDTSVGGHIAWGETLGESLKRETFEEIGLQNFKPVFFSKYVWETDAEKELVYMFITVTSLEPVFNPAEVSEGRFWSMQSIEKNMNKDIFTPNLEHEIRMLRKSGIPWHYQQGLK